MSSKQTSGRFPRIMKLVLHGVKHLFLHNRWAKLISLLISLVIWAGLISQDPNLTRDKSFQNVPVAINGTATLRSKGYIVVSNLEEALTNVSAVASVPQQQVDNADQSAYNFRVDLSRINSVGDQELRILSSKNSTYGEVTSISPATVMVSIAEYEERQRIPLNLEVSGKEPEGWHMKKSSVDPVLMSISGPRDLVQSVSRGKVFLNLDEVAWEEGDWLDSLEIKLFNRSGEEVNNEYLTITTGQLNIDSAVVEEIIVPTRTFDTVDEVNNLIRPAEGYQLRSVSVSPESVVVADASNVLNSMVYLGFEGTEALQELTQSGEATLTVVKPSVDAEILTNSYIRVKYEISPVDTD